MNQLILGDNFEVLKKIESETVDLIYLDPPFFSNRTYEVIWGDEGEIRSFQDRWSGGIDHYIGWLKERVEQMHRILKPTGSIFLHCDWHAHAYIKVDILDKIFGYHNFRGEIIWQRHNAHNKTTTKLQVLTDTIWYYSKSDKFIYNKLYSSLSDDYKNGAYRYKDDNGVYRLSDLTGSGLRTGESSVTWKGYNPNERNRHWAVPSKAIENMISKVEAAKLTVIEKLELLLKNELIEFSKNGVPSFKRYLDTSEGNLLGNIWLDIQNVQSQSKERIGYPTQKPEKLLERIIEMSTKKGDLVLDPFVGGGTTIAIAEKLERNWIGIDQSVQAVKVTELRLQKGLNLFSKPFVVQLHKYDYDTLRNKKAFEFETWIIEQFGGTPNTKQRGDFGIDGKTNDNTPIQVKRSDNIGRNVIDNFKSACERFDKPLYDKNISENKPIGIIIAFSFGRGAVEEVARLKNKENVFINLVTVAEIVPIAVKPKLTVTFNDKGTDSKKLREIEFTAKAESDSGIEFFAWDWNFNEEKGFNAEILLDKEGKQTQKFKAGSHKIAVKVIDNEGLENFEIIKLKVNGKIELTN